MYSTASCLEKRKDRGCDTRGREVERGSGLSRGGLMVGCGWDPVSLLLSLSLLLLDLYISRRIDWIQRISLVPPHSPHRLPSCVLCGVLAVLLCLVFGDQVCLSCHSSLDNHTMPCALSSHLVREPSWPDPAATFTHITRTWYVRRRITPPGLFILLVAGSIMCVWFNGGCVGLL